MTVRRLVLEIEVDVEEDEHGLAVDSSGAPDEDGTTIADYPSVFGSFVANEVDNCVEMPGLVVGYTARWAEEGETA